MLIFLTTLLTSLASIFRSRASLGLENLALRHQIGVLHRSAGKRPKIDRGRPPAVDLSGASLARLALGVAHRQARNGRSLASCRLSLVLDLEGALRKTRTTRHFKRTPRPDPQDVPAESRLGCTTDPRRTAQTGHRRRAEQCQQIYGPLPQTAVSHLAHLPGEPCPAAGLHRLLHRAHHPVPGPLRISGVGHDRRRILHFNVTAHPTADWTGQQLREAFPFAQLPRYLLRDRDAIFGDDFREHLRDMGICEVLSAPKKGVWDLWVNWRVGLPQAHLSLAIPGTIFSSLKD